LKACRQHEEIRRGERAPSREFYVNAARVKEVLARDAKRNISAEIKRGMKQVRAGHAAREWEQGRRQPSGAARSLLTIATRKPDVLREVFAE